MKISSMLVLSLLATSGAGAPIPATGTVAKIFTGSIHLSSLASLLPRTLASLVSTPPGDTDALPHRLIPRVLAGPSKWSEIRVGISARRATNTESIEAPLNHIAPRSPGGPRKWSGMRIGSSSKRDGAENTDEEEDDAHLEDIQHFSAEIQREDAVGKPVVEDSSSSGDNLVSALDKARLSTDVKSAGDNLGNRVGESA